ncbi:unnamed protein product [Aphanomyces euteiches]
MLHALTLLVGAYLAAAGTTSAPTYTPPPTPVAWTMKTVRTVQARVQSSAPVWDSTQKLWVANFPSLKNDPTDKWAAALDTVNTASVEGSLFYVQTEGIGTDVDNACARKTNMSYIWFYDIKIVQPYFAVAEYGSDTGKVPEYGAFVAMDNGMCTLQGTTVPAECLQFTGLNYNPDLGPYIGGETRKTHPRANYTNNVWFSFPGSCFLKAFGAKTAACLADATQQGRMCAKGVEPDGVNCTYSFSVIGYLSIDDLVGITNQTNPNTGKPFGGRVEFCKAGLVEFDFNTNKSDLTSGFWNDPLNSTANDVRTQKMMQMYSDLVTNGLGDAKNMQPFPDVQTLTKANPACYENNILCSQATYGCRRKLLSQVCEVCTSQVSDCVKKPDSAAPFPTLVKQYVPPKPTVKGSSPSSPSSASGSSSSSGSSTSGGGSTASGSSNAMTLSATVACAIAMVVALLH